MTEVAMELLHDRWLEANVRRAGVDGVEHGAVAGDLLLRAVGGSRLVGDERLDALARRGDVLDRVGCLCALDASDRSQRLERLGMHAMTWSRNVAPAGHT